MAVTCDPEHKFELAIQLGDLRSAYELAKETQAEQKWKQLAELAIRRCEFGLAQECLHQVSWPLSSWGPGGGGGGGGTNALI